EYWKYGYGKVGVIQKHKMPASLRHLVPGLFVASLISLTVMATFSDAAKWLLLAEIALYLLANLTATLVTCREPRNIKFITFPPLLFIIYHFGYGYGFLRGMIDFVLVKRGGSKSFSVLTRGEAAGTDQYRQR